MRANEGCRVLERAACGVEYLIARGLLGVSELQGRGDGCLLLVRGGGRWQRRCARLICQYGTRDVIHVFAGTHELGLRPRADLALG